MMICGGCGAWSASEDVDQPAQEKSCTECGWMGAIASEALGHTAEDGRKLDSATLRALLDVELRSDGTAVVSLLHTARLRLLSTDPQLGSALDQAVGDAIGTSSPGAAGWQALREEATALIQSRVDEILRPRWPGSLAHVDPMPVAVRFRVFKLDEARARWRSSVDWLVMVSLTKALKKAGAACTKGDVRLTWVGPALGFSHSMEPFLIQALSQRSELMVTGAVLGVQNKTLQTLEAHRLLPRNRTVTILEGRAQASMLHVLASQKSASLSLRIKLLGGTTLRLPVPTAELGDPNQLVDYFLDIGSTTSKTMVRVAGKNTQPLKRGTVALTAALGLPPFIKAAFLADKTGVAWAGWVTQLVAALRVDASKRHGGYLRGIYLTLPDAGVLSVDRVSGILTRSQKSSHARGVDAAFQELRSARDFHQVGEVGLVLVAEHLAVADHYLTPLRVLRKAAEEYGKRRAGRASEVRRDTARLESWRQRKTSRDKYNRKGFFGKIFSAKPPSPGARPSVQASLQAPAAWMTSLIADPTQLDRVIILDAGGLSLDIAVIEDGALVAALSRSDSSAGGEALSEALARRLSKPFVQGNEDSSKRWTKHKATLGNRWFKKDEPDAPASLQEKLRTHKSQPAYREVTRRHYDGSLNALFRDCMRRWKKTPSCVVFLTGGGSANPHFAELVAEQVRVVGLQAEARDARALVGLIEAACEFPQRLPALEDPAIEHFRTVHDWAFAEEAATRRGLYDAFAVVGGLMQRTLQ